MKGTYGSGSGGSHLYSIEARISSTARDARKIAGNLLVKEWKQLNFITAPAGLGIPNLTHHPIKDRHLGLFTYEAALALAYWFLACPDDDATWPFHPSGVEARLVQVELTYSYSTKEIGVGDPFSNEERAGNFAKRGDLEAGTTQGRLRKDSRSAAPNTEGMGSVFNPERNLP